MNNRPLGTRQIDLLRQLANPHLFLIIGDKVAESLVRRGLVAETGVKGGFFQITPAGMRLMADMWEAGKITFDPPPRTRSPKSDVKENGDA